MERSTENKIVIVVRRTRLDELIMQFNTEDQARFYIEHLGADFLDYQQEDRVYKNAVRVVENVLSRHGRVQVLDRRFIPSYLFGDHDIVVAVGQDGLVANILKYLSGQLLIGVNPDPQRMEGTLLPFVPIDLEKIILEVFAGKRRIQNVTMAQATLNTGESIYGVNDLFVGPRTHTSARYTIGIGDRTELQSSSGVIISTGLGSTGWLRSILTGASGIVSALRGHNTTVQDNHRFDWDARYLYFSVREPWPSKTTSAMITFGKLTPDKPLVITSHMTENGVIFSDGIEVDYLKFNSGTVATIDVAGKMGCLVI